MNTYTSQPVANTRRVALAAALAAFTAAFLNTSASATDYTWTSDSFSNWTDSSRWSPNTSAPGAGDTAIINAHFGGLRINTDITVANLTNNSVPLSGHVHITPSGAPGVTTTLNITGTLSVVNGGSSNTFTIRGESGGTAGLNLNVNHINVSASTLRLGTSHNTANAETGGRRELNQITVAGTTTIGASGSSLLINALSATFGKVDIGGGALVLINEDASAADVTRTVSVAGLSGWGGVASVSSAQGSLTAGNTRAATLVINGGEYASFSGIIADKISSTVGGTASLSVVKQGTGIQKFWGANSYSGSTTILGGTLLAVNLQNSSYADRPEVSSTGTGAVFVNGGTLAGNGYINGATTVASGARLAPSGDSQDPNTVGTLTIRNSLTLGNGAFLDFNLATPGAQGGAEGNDFINVTGDVAIGSSITLNLIGGEVADGIYQIIGGGSFSGVGNLTSWTVTGLSAGQSAIFGNSEDAIFMIVSSAAIPEPAMAGVIIGLGALALGAARRHGRK